VHALGQVAAFTLKRTIASDAVVRALNVRLPETVRVLEAEAVSGEFHPQFAARSKTYRYRIWNGGVLNPFERRYAWHVIGALDVAAMEAAARLLEGTHDFIVFQASGSETRTTVRTVFSSLVLRQAEDERRDQTRSVEQSSLVVSLSNHQPIITYEVTGDGFLRHMVRTIVGTLVEIGRGRRAPGWMSELVASRDRSRAGPTAPPHGLFLTRVDYQTPGAPCE
jgi:tRNA pseudouridine38-40 synthase